MRHSLFLSMLVVCSVIYAEEKNSPSDMIDAKLSKAKLSFSETVDKAQKSLLADLDKKIKLAMLRGSLELVEKLRAEKNAFTNEGKLPTSVKTMIYERMIQKAMGILEDEFDAAIKDYVQADKIDEAKRLKSELTEIKNSLSGQFDKNAIAEFEMLSGGKGIAVLRDGNKLYSNRGYSWVNTPEQFPFKRFIMVLGGGKDPLSFKVTKSGWIYGALSSEKKDIMIPYLEKESWESTKMELSVAGNNKSRYIFRKRYDIGAHAIPRLNFSGPILLLP